ncbi:5,10-methylenetetrahydrofolate reductase [Chthoniobacter flavus Ellin428]|uniref:Methylenetetrahydrofolate reductase n=1 Tax=Chthoniobacter flavus Ellin428 TaxID=497964 RepID=B4CZD6_9BACT|nr:methylenetetrahydrofolate reductase [NAD(P)H] [Chthoniobacter flavus]EDY20827.1 5,10-methylenetetrahydrofolate reductase [Chthoniobacter flavus Ellin428]TCO89717.1 5,10-methylenetetrahydrofolate reductase (NAD(P)) [Chthoniobacter flavus]
MHIQDILARNKTSISLEFFPPRTPESSERLFQTIAELAPFAPSFASVTYGAGGATRELTHDLVVRLRRTTALDPIPHLTCVGHTAEDIHAVLARYAAAGVSNLLALRGDLPQGSAASASSFAQAADLVGAIRAFKHPHETRGFGIGVAGFPDGHPLTPNRLREMDHLKAKVDAGADYICTQLFFDNHSFHDFRERCELGGIRAPILAGVMPVTTLSGLQRMAELAAGVRIPAKLLKRLAASGNDPHAVAEIGIQYAIEQCADLLRHGVSGIHLYTLNQSAASVRILRSLERP